MKQFVRGILAGALMLVSHVGALAYSDAGSALRSRSLPSASALSDAEPALAPLAFVQFCKAYEEQCKSNASRASIALDARSWEDLQQVNARINAAIAPDEAKGGFDWSLETRLGNCNDYAVQKRNALIKLGYPMAALSLAVVKTPFGEGHLVLTVRTDRGDLVLDNRRATIVAWSRTGYAWLKRQSAENPQYWVAVSTKPVAPRPAPSVPAVQEPVRLKDIPSSAGTVVASLNPLPTAISIALGLRSTIELTHWAGFVPVEPVAVSLGEIVSKIAKAGTGSPLVSLALNSVGGLQVLSRVE